MNEVETVMQMLQQYFGRNVLLVLAFFAILHWTKGSKNRKKYLICVIVMFALLLNDFVFHLIKKVGEEDTYYRILWIIPVTLFAAYLIIELWSELSGYKRIGMAILMGVFLWIYTVPSWTSWGNLPTNIYQLDDEIIEVADIIEKHSGGEHVNIIDDDTISWHVREYSENLCIPGIDDEELLLMIQEKKLDFSREEVEEIAFYARVDYIIVQKNKEKANELFGKTMFELIGSSKNYNIYFVNRPAVAQHLSNN